MSSLWWRDSNKTASGNLGTVQPVKCERCVTGHRLSRRQGLPARARSSQYATDEVTDPQNRANCFSNHPIAQKACLEKVASPMSALGYKQTSSRPKLTSAVPPKADILVAIIDFRL